MILKQNLRIGTGLTKVTRLVIGWSQDFNSDVTGSKAHSWYIHFPNVHFSAAHLMSAHFFLLLTFDTDFPGSAHWLVNAVYPEFSQGHLILTDKMELGPFSIGPTLMGIKIYKYLHKPSGKHLNIHCSLLKSNSKRHHLSGYFQLSGSK